MPGLNVRAVLQNASMAHRLGKQLVGEMADAERLIAAGGEEGEEEEAPTSGRRFFARFVRLASHLGLSVTSLLCRADLLEC